MRIALIAFLLALAGCATTTQAPSPTVWDAEQVSRLSADRTQLQSKNGQYMVGVVSVGNVRELVEIARKIEEQAGVTAHVYLIEGTEPNALSTSKNGQNFVAVNLAMLELVEGDKAAIAALLGHEYAHLALAHGQQRAERESTRQGASQALGVFLSVVGVPMGGTVANVATTAVATTYTRDEERDADKYGMQYAKQAGFSPWGAVTLWQKMSQRSSGPNPLAFLSTHPQSGERLETMKQLAASME